MCRLEILHAPAGGAPPSWEEERGPHDAQSREQQPTHAPQPPRDRNPGPPQHVGLGMQPSSRIWGYKHQRSRTSVATPCIRTPEHDRSRSRGCARGHRRRRRRRSRRTCRPLGEQAEAVDARRAVERLRRVVERERRHRRGGERLHLDAGAVVRAHRRAHVDAAGSPRPGRRRTSAPVTAIGWQKGSRSGVRFTPITPAIRAASSGLPFGVPATSRPQASGVIVHDALGDGLALGDLLRPDLDDPRDAVGTRLDPGHRLSPPSTGTASRGPRCRPRRRLDARRGSPRARWRGPRSRSGWSRARPSAWRTPALAPCARRARARTASCPCGPATSSSSRAVTSGRYRFAPAHHLHDRRADEQLEAHEHAHGVARQAEVGLALDVPEPLGHPRLHRDLVEVDARRGGRTRPSPRRARRPRRRRRRRTRRPGSRCESTVSFSASTSSRTMPASIGTAPASRSAANSV